MGFDPLSLLKRLRGASSADGDGYGPYLTSSLGDDNDSSDSNGGSNSNIDHTRPRGNDPSKEQGTALNPEATRPPGVGTDEPHSGGSDSDNNNPASNPGIDPHVPVHPNPSVENPHPGVGQTVIGTTQVAPAPTQVDASATFANPGIDPTITPESTAEPTETAEVFAASSSDGSDTTKVVAIAVPVVVVCVALIAGLFFFMWRRRKRQAAQTSDDHFESSNPDMTQNNAVDSSPSRLVPPPLPTMTHDPAETSRSSEPSQNPNNNQRLSAVSVQLQRAQPSAVVNRPQSHIKRNSVQQESTALTEENLATLGDTPQGYSYQRPRSPFDHPDDDAVSAISGLSPGGHDPRNQGRDADEVSAVSSLEPADMPQRRPQ